MAKVFFGLFLALHCVGSFASLSMDFSLQLDFGSLVGSLAIASGYLASQSNSVLLYIHP
ncbi:hypothetical protein K474DRAFT_1665052 [Panus rudis PR-1116 ss-1]|nr:hypothetical protein K474DRAFT_1665052 [Panus rudis PR-1116 ss-1]